MTIYAARTRAPEVSYFADVTMSNGATTWEHVRTNLGRKVAYSMIAKHYDGCGKIAAFRDESNARYEDRMWSEGDDGVLTTNIWYGYGEAAR